LTFFSGCVHHFHPFDKIFEKIILREGGYILAHNFRSVTPWSFSSVASGPSDGLDRWMETDINFQDDSKEKIFKVLTPKHLMTST
jgi:hypothetical protein